MNVHVPVCQMQPLRAACQGLPPTSGPPIQATTQTSKGCRSGGRRTRVSRPTPASRRDCRRRRGGPIDTTDHKRPRNGRLADGSQFHVRLSPCADTIADGSPRCSHHRRAPTARPDAQPKRSPVVRGLVWAPSGARGSGRTPRDQTAKALTPGCARCDAIPQVRRLGRRGRPRTPAPDVVVSVAQDATGITPPGPRTSPLATTVPEPQAPPLSEPLLSVRRPVLLS